MTRGRGGIGAEVSVNHQNYILLLKNIKHNALYELQHGFREKRSCETQLIQLVEDLGRQLTLGKQTDLALLDFNKAFDKVNHLKLLYKLACFGIKGNTLK